MKKFLYTGISVVLATSIFTGCATKSSDLQTSYVSPLQYHSYNCQQISLEMQRVSSKVESLGGQIDKKATGDKVAMGVGLVLFWPALFFLDGDGPEAQEYSRLKGEYDALTQASIEKQCNLKTSMIDKM